MSSLVKELLVKFCYILYNFCNHAQYFNVYNNSMPLNTFEQSCYAPFKTISNSILLKFHIIIIHAAAFIALS